MKVRCIVVCLLVLGLVLPAAVAAQGEQALARDQWVSDTLPGSQGGSFAYYRIAYPGDEVDLRIQVRFDHKNSTSPVGFNVYGPDGRTDAGDWQSEHECLEVTYQEEESAELVVQVYNYGEDATSYSITTDGLPEAVAEAVPVAAAETVVLSSDIWTAASGVIVGNQGGAFAYHDLAYDGDEKDVTVTINMFPADPTFHGAFGLNVYDSDGDLVATAGETDKECTCEVTWADEDAEMYHLQVFNYTDGVTMTYYLEAEVEDD